MSVDIEPAELGFHRPFNNEVTQILKIKNPNVNPVAFKVKTTAPKQYCVRPNSGRIEPGKEVEVTVSLQPFKIEPPADTKCKDKFLVQTVAVTADKEFENIAEIWSHVEQADKKSVQEKKIRVTYLAPEGSSLGVSATPLKNGIGGTGLDGRQHQTPEAPPAYGYPGNRSPSPEAFTPDNRGSSAAPISALASKKDDEKPATTSVATKISNAAPTYEELKAKLADAQATIANYANEGGLKMRNVAKGETGNATVDNVAHRVQNAQGVPLQIVAALCLVSFLLAYIFF